MHFNRVHWAICGLGLIGCAGAGPETDGDASGVVAPVPVGSEPGLEGAEYVGHIEDVGPLPDDRLIAIMADGSAYLLPASSIDYSKMTGSPDRSLAHDEPVPGVTAPTDSEPRPIGETQPSRGESVGSVSEAIKAPSLFTDGVVGQDNRFPLYSSTNNLSESQKRVVDLHTDPACSGSFIGPRHVLTAAHCVYFPGFGWAQPPYVVPGQQGICKHQNWACSNGITREPLGRKDRYTTVVPTNWINTGGDSRYDQAAVITQDYASFGSWFSTSFGVAPYPPASPTHQGYPSPDYPCQHSPGPSATGFDAPWDKPCYGFQYRDYGSYVVQHDSNFVWLNSDSQGGESGSPMIYGDTVYGSLMGRQGDFGAYHRVMSSVVCDVLARFPSTIYGNPVCF